MSGARAVQEKAPTSAPGTLWRQGTSQMTNLITTTRHRDVPVLPAKVELIEQELRDLLQWAKQQPFDVRLQVFAFLMQS